MSIISRDLRVALLGRAQPVDAQPLADAVPDRRARVERRVRVLEDDLHPAAEGPQRRRRRACVMSSPSKRMVPAVGLDEAQDEAADRGLAAARLAHQAQRLAAPDDEVHAVDGPDLRDRALEHAAPDGEGLGQAADLDQRLGRPGGRRPWPPSRDDARRRPWRLRRWSADGAGGVPWPAAIAASSSGSQAPSAGRSEPSGAVDSASSGPGGRRRSGGSSGWLVEGVAGCRPRSRTTQRGAKRQPLGQRQHVGHVARDRGQLIASDARHRHGADQARGCRDAGARANSVRTSACSTISPAYITATRSHISATTPRSWVMRMIAVPGLLLEVAHQVQDLGLDGHVQRGRGLVGDEQLRLAGERHGDHHALRHAARHLVRVGLDAPVRVGDADHAHQLQRTAPAPPCASCPGGAPGPRAIWQPTGHHRVERATVGCWKTIAMRSPRILRSSSSGQRRAGPGRRTGRCPPRRGRAWRRGAGSTAR